MALAENASNDSAQSPAWSRKPWPAATLASAAWSVRASPAKTSGGSLATCARTSSAAWSGQSGCCAADSERQPVGDQPREPVAFGGACMAAILAAARRSGKSISRGRRGGRQASSQGSRRWCWRPASGRPTSWPPADQRVASVLGLEPPQGQLQHVGAAARAVIGGDEVAADPQRVEDHAAGLDVVLVGAEGTE